MKGVEAEALRWLHPLPLSTAWTPSVGITRGSREVDYKTLAKGFVWIAPVKREIAGPKREANNSY